MSQTPKKMTDDWLELGSDVVRFICAKLDVDPALINMNAASHEVVPLAKAIGAAAVFTLRSEISEIETKGLVARLKEKK